MAKITTIKNADGTVSYGAHVRIRPFRTTWQSFPSKKAAEEWRDALTKELLKQRRTGGARPDIPTLTVAALNKDFLDDPDTKRLRYFKDLERQLRWWTLKYGAVKVLDFGVLQLREARASLMPGRAPATVVRTLSAQRSAWNWGRASGLVPNDKGWPPRLMLKEPRARVRYLGDEELKSVLAAAKSHSATVHAAVTVALGCGVRQGEMLRLTWADVDFARSRIRLLLTKNNEARSVFLPATAADALKSLKAAAIVSTKHVFLTDTGEPLTGQKLDRHWRKVRAAAGLKDFRWHDFRHSAASYLAQNGATLLEIGSVLGHRSAQVTMKYAHLVDGAAVTGHRALDEKLRNSDASFARG